LIFSNLNNLAKTNPRNQPQTQPQPQTQDKMSDMMSFMMQLMEERARGAELMGRYRSKIIEVAKNSVFNHVYQHKPGHFNQWVMTTVSQEDPECIALSIGYPCDSHGYPEVFLAKGTELFLERKKGEFSSSRWDPSEDPVKCENIEECLRVLRETSNALLGLPNEKGDDSESESDSYEDPTPVEHPED